jgi:hypothetical protein
MKVKTRIVTIVVASLVMSVTAGAGEGDVLHALESDENEVARINLNPWGPHLGFEAEINSDDPALKALVRVIAGAEPGGGHKCSNRGAIRFRLAGGRSIAVGLLPSHDEGVSELRLYEGDRLQGAYRLQRAELLAALADLGVPTDDPAFAD